MKAGNAEVVGGTTCEELARRVARRLNRKFVKVHRKKFPDGESYVRLLRKPSSKRAIVFQTLYPQNDSTVELTFILDLLEEFDVEQVWLVIPYFAYARQHKRYRKWECVSAKSLARLIESFENVEKVFLLDLHDESILNFFRRCKTIHLSARRLLAEYFSRKKLNDPFVLIPDQERKELAISVSSELGCDYSFLVKYRSRVTGEITTRVWKDFDVNGKEVLILDDVISTGKTMLNAIKIVKEGGAREIYCAATHYIPSKAHEMLMKAGAKEVIATNSIPSEISKLDLAPLFAEALSGELSKRR